jgi:phosphatidylglycerol:prolipoprotein diacylglycerol transferase
LITHYLAAIAANASAIRYEDLGLDPIIFHVGRFAVRWYSLAYLAGIIVGWWYLLKLLAKPGAPMARRHADDLVFYATLGIILGGRLGYVLFYKPDFYFHEPLQILKLWDGGMSFHGGVLGTTAGIVYLARKNGLNWLRIHDYVACCAPFGLFFGRLANFVNHELWGRVTDVPWAVIFPEIPTGRVIDGVPVLLDGPARHPSQLYEAGLEGILLFLILWFLFWRTDARYYPGRLVGVFLLVYGASRFLVEYWREADVHLVDFAQRTGLHMGQWLSVPMILGGVWLIATSGRRRQRVEPIAGGESVA